MTNVCLIRVDFRLMHGQVIANWLKQLDGNAIMIVNDQLAADAFMKNVYKMAAPKGVKVVILGIDKAVERIQSDRYQGLKMIVLFKSVTDLKAAYDKGFPMNKIQIGGLGSGEDRIQITNQIYLNVTDTEMLMELAKKGVDIHLQTVPKEAAIPIDRVASKVLERKGEN